MTDKMTSFEVIDNDKTYIFHVKRLSSLEWYKFFEMCLSLFDKSDTGKDATKFMHILAQTGKHTKEDMSIDIESLGNQELLGTFFSVIKDALLGSSFEEHKSIYDILLKSMYLEEESAMSTVSYSTFDDFENRFTFYQVMFKALCEHFDFLQKFKTLQKSQI